MITNRSPCMAKQVLSLLCQVFTLRMVVLDNIELYDKQQPLKRRHLSRLIAFLVQLIGRSYGYMMELTCRCTPSNPS